MKEKYDVIIIIDSGIGNAIQTLYAVEYLMHQNIKVGYYLGSISQTFQKYLSSCYPGVIINGNIAEVEVDILIHGFTYQGSEMPKFNKHIYVSADYHSTRIRSETEQFLDVVRSLYPSGYHCFTLKLLKEDYSDSVKALDISNKTVLYPGCHPSNPAKRWPYFSELMEIIGKENTIIVGGNDDLNFSYSYYYPKWITSFFHQKFLNNKKFWQLNKKLNFLKKHAHWPELSKLNNAYMNVFDWPELVSIFRRCKSFIGNDGGLSHLAAASGAKGTIIYGPTSVKKNKPYSKDIMLLKNDCCCSQFGEEGKVQTTKEYINCPCQVKCLYDCTPERVLKNKIV